MNLNDIEDIEVVACASINFDLAGFLFIKGGRYTRYEWGVQVEHYVKISEKHN